MENPIKMDDLGVPLFSETSKLLQMDLVISFFPVPSPIVVDLSYSNKENHVRHESDVSFRIAFGKLYILLMEMMEKKPPSWGFPKIVVPPNRPF